MAIEVVTEEVAQNLEEMAEVTRRLNTKSIGLFLGGVAVGAAVGFYFGHRWNREKIKAEAFKESEKEVEQIREVYQQKTLAAQPKPSVEEVIEERGYEAVEEQERPTRPPVPVREPVSAPPIVTYDGGRDKNAGWNYAYELANRSPEHPFIIHQDEFMPNESGYNQVTYTYYAEDDVLTAEDNKPLPHADQIVGQDNLKFGHGTDDIDVVYVRNSKLELEMEICRVAMSYEREVLGIERDESN